MPTCAEPAGPTVLLLAAPLPPPYGGIAKYLQRAIPSLTALGYRVHAIQPPGAPPPSLSCAFAGVSVETLAWPGRGRAAQFLLRHLLSLVPILVRWLPALIRRPGFALSQLYAFTAWCMAADAAARRLRPDLVHAFDYPWLQGLAALWVARRTGARCVVSTFGEVVPHRDELRQVDEVSRPFRGLSHYALARVDAASSMTEHCRCQVAQVDIDPARLRLVRFVVGMEPFHPAVDGSAVRARYAADGAALLLFVGQLRGRKGPQTLLSALPAVLRRHPGTRLLLVGPDHGYAAALRATAERLGVAQAVHFVGAVPDAELPAYYAACDLFLFPTLTPIECLGLTFVQAMFAGRPVIATRIAGAPEVIREGTDGFLVPAGDADAFAARIAELLALAPAARAALGAAARARAVALFDEADVLRDLAALYAETLGGGGGR